MEKKAKKLNLGCGKVIKEGYINVDRVGNPDIKYDLNKYPYPFKKNSVDFILASHVLEHVKEPMDFLKECYRILKKGGRVKIKVPHCQSPELAFGAIEHRHCYHEFAINDVVGKGAPTEFLENPFKLIETKVRRARFRKWKKLEITWIIEKS